MSVHTTPPTGRDLAHRAVPWDRLAASPRPATEALMRTPEHDEAWHRMLVGTFVSLADTLTETFDVVDLFQDLSEGIVELELADECGILLADADGQLRVVAASKERTRLLELFQLQAQQGPCLDCWRRGEHVGVADLERQRERWPSFAPQAIEVGFRAVDAIPLQLRAEQLGALNLFHVEAGTALANDRVVAQGLADIAAIALMQQRVLRDSRVAAEQLQHALHSRIAVEQAKGMLAERASESVDDAFRRLRSYARSRQLGLSALAQDLVNGEVALDAVASAEELAPRGRD